VGRDALQANTTASNNTAVGYQALYANTTGQNTAVGYRAMYSTTTGGSNTAIGGYYNLISPLYNNTTGSYNTAVGEGSLAQNTTANDNVAVGYGALYNNTTGTANVALGRQAFTSVTTNSGNTGLGYIAGYFSTGSNNTYLGSSCGAQNGASTGSGNVAVGQTAHYSLTTGSYNVAIGIGAGKNLTTGNGNTEIGTVDSAGNYNPVNNISTASNVIVMGSTGITNAYVKVSWTVTSDARDKTNVAPIGHGLNFVNQLNPVSYRFTDNRIDKNPTGDTRYGFLAQDILALEGDNPVIIDNKNEEQLMYNGESLVPVLVKAIQELKAEIDSLKQQLGK
jgi:hypothetical protein